MAIISSYPTLIPQLGDKVLGSNILDAAGNPVVGNPTVQFDFTDIKALVDQQYIEQFESSSTVLSQASALNTMYSVQFGAPTGTTSTNVELLQGGGSATAGDTVEFHTLGTYQILLTYLIGVSASAANIPYLVFRTLQDDATQIGPTIAYEEKFENMLKPVPLIIPLTINITAVSTKLKFQMARTGTINNGGLVKTAAPINITGLTEPSIATLKISKLI